MPMVIRVLSGGARGVRLSLPRIIEPSHLCSIHPVIAVRVTGTAPKWVIDGFHHYLAGIELANPDGFAAWDYPFHKANSLDYLKRMMTIFPHDPRLWPIFSIRWTWDDKAHLNFSRLPAWASTNLASLIPLNRTQRQYKEETRERAGQISHC